MPSACIIMPFISLTEIQTQDPDHDQNVTIDALDRSANDPAEFCLHFTFCISQTFS